MRTFCWSMIDQGLISASPFLVLNVLRKMSQTLMP